MTENLVEISSSKINSIYGAHRVLEPANAMPQSAWKISANLPLADNELLIKVATLNIDAASFRQIKNSVNGDSQQIAKQIIKIVAERGKMHNPLTGSGGMLIGEVAEIGKNHPAINDLKVGERIATLVSLSLTPLRIFSVKQVFLERDQVDISGEAILFASGIYAKLPNDINDKCALAILDVAGAPAQTARLARPGDTVVVIGGGGKSGTLCIYEAKKAVNSLGKTGLVIGVSPFAEDCQRMRDLGWADIVLQVDASNALAMLAAVEQATSGKLADLTINCVNVPNCELSSILATREGGKVYFFSMTTSFTAAALGAEGVGKDVEMIIGNGYTKGHANYALNLLRESKQLKQLFAEKYAV